MTDNDNNELKGLDGWLILVGIGVVIGPIMLFVTSPIFDTGVWETLTTVGSESVYPLYLGLLVAGEMVGAALFMIASLYLIYLFFSKHYLFPKVYIGVTLAALIFFLLDAWLAAKIFPSEPIFDDETAKEFVRTLISVAIWVPYMLVSKRVRLTFVKNLPNKKTQPISDSVG